MKKYRDHLIIAVLAFALGVWAGRDAMQQNVDKMQQQIEAMQQEISQGESQGVHQSVDASTFSLIDQYADCTAIGLEKVSEDINPWKVTTGIIDIDGVSSVLFMSPNTGVCAEITIPENAVITLEGRIHPWMDDLSDGATLCVKVGDREQLIHYEVGKNFVSTKIDLSDLAGQTVQISLTCVQEENQNGDWIVLRTASVS